jgi:multiple sugar transport system ATP-binding protein
MKLGVIQQVGTPQRIYNQPANLFVAGFIGTPSMNFIDCTVQPEDGAWRLRSQYLSLVLPSDCADKLSEAPAGRQLMLGIRPEHVWLMPEATPGATSCQVFVVEPQSNEFVVGAKLGQQLIKARRDRRKMDFRPEVGQRIWLQFPVDKIHLFDKETEACLL